MKNSSILFSFFLIMGFVLPMSLSAQGVPSPKKSPRHVKVVKKAPTKHPVQKHQTASLSRQDIPMRKIKADPSKSPRKAYLVAPANRKRSAVKQGQAAPNQKTINAAQKKKRK